MTFKFDSYVVPNSPVKLMTLPDHVWVTATASDANTTGIFISNSEANVQAGGKRSRLDAGVGLPFLANSDDELWAMAQDNSGPELVIMCSDGAGSITGGSLGSGIPNHPQIGGHWGKVSQSQVDNLTVTGISVIASNTYFCAIANEDQRKTDSVTGMGLTWVKVKEKSRGNDVTTSIWRGTGTPSGPGEVTGNFSGAGTASSTAMMVFSVTKLDTSDPVIQTKEKETTGTSVQFGDVDVENQGMVLEVIGEDVNTTYTQTSGATHVASYGTGTDVAIHVAQFSPTATGHYTVNGQLGASARWAGIAVGLRRQP